ncbi:MAG: esterase [Saprospiraceae bacterium]|nr:esterase [Saprospiraceae bacterium]
MHKHILILLLSFLNPACLPTVAQNLPLYYLLRQPKIKVEKPPVLLLLHGLGSDETDLFSFAEQLPDDFLILSLRAPYEMGPMSYSWFGVDFSSGKMTIDEVQAEESRQVLIRFLESLPNKIPIDKKRVYLCGFSQGAMMSYSIGLTRPDLVSGIAVMSGRLLDETTVKATKPTELQSLSVFIAHGTNDKRLDIQYARDASAYLRTLNVIPKYKEYDEGHGMNVAMLNDLLFWLKNE